MVGMGKSAARRLMQPKFRLNFVNSRNSVTFAGEELFECNALQNAELRTVAMSLLTF